jgi:hypothetical protein
LLVKPLAAIGTLVLGIFALIVSITTYLSQKSRDHELAESNARLHRFEMFQQMQKRYREDKAIEAVLRAMYPEQYQPPPPPVALKDVPTADKFTFMSFYEEVAVMVNTGLMDPDMAYWFFGLDAANFYNKETEFRTQRTWTLFNTFAQKVADRHPQIPEEEIVRMKL